MAVANQLRAHLEVVFPGVVGLFSDLDSPISLAFLRRFPSAGKAARLSEKRLAAWLRTQSYGGRRPAADLYRHLAQAPAGLLGEEREAHSTVTLAFVTLLETLDTQIKALKRRIAELLDAHPEWCIRDHATTWIGDITVQPSSVFRHVVAVVRDAIRRWILGRLWHDRHATSTVANR